MTHSFVKALNKLANRLLSSGLFFDRRLTGCRLQSDKIYQLIIA